MRRSGGETPGGMFKVPWIATQENIPFAKGGWVCFTFHRWRTAELWLAGRVCACPQVTWFMRTQSQFGLGRGSRQPDPLITGIICSHSSYLFHPLPCRPHELWFLGSSLFDWSLAMSVMHLSFLDEEPETGSPLKPPHTHLSHPSPFFLCVFFLYPAQFTCLLTQGREIVN